MFLCYSFYCYIVYICSLYVLPQDHVQSGLNVTATYCVVQILCVWNWLQECDLLLINLLYMIMFMQRDVIRKYSLYWCIKLWRAPYQLWCISCFLQEGWTILLCVLLPVTDHTYLWVELQDQFRSSNVVYDVIQKNVVCISTAMILISLPESSHVVTPHG